jgi:hypothetical protein
MIVKFIEECDASFLGSTFLVPPVGSDMLQIDILG